MSVGRYARHTKPQLLQAIREKVIYAVDMAVGENCTLSNVGPSSAMQINKQQQQNGYAIADLKVPIDRVPGTPIRFKIVYTGTAQVGNIVFYMSYIVVGLGENLAGALATQWLIQSAPPPNYSKTSDEIWIHAVKIDGKLPSVDIQMRIGRDGTHALDTNAGNVYILKVIAEYTAYV